MLEAKNRDPCQLLTSVQYLHFSGCVYMVQVTAQQLVINRFQACGGLQSIPVNNVLHMRYLVKP